jgi:hypothetical protein
VWLCVVVTVCPVSTLLRSTKGVFVMSSRRRFRGVYSV